MTAAGASELALSFSESGYLLLQVHSTSCTSLELHLRLTEAAAHKEGSCPRCALKSNPPATRDLGLTALSRTTIRLLRNRCTVGDVALAWSSWLKTRAQRPNPLLDVVITTVSGPAKPLAKGTQYTRPRFQEVRYRMADRSDRHGGAHCARGSLLTGSTGAATSLSHSKAPNVTVVMGTTDRIVSADPAGSYDLPSWTIIYNVYQTLRQVPSRAARRSCPTPPHAPGRAPGSTSMSAAATQPVLLQRRPGNRRGRRVLLRADQQDQRPERAASLISA